MNKNGIEQGHYVSIEKKGSGFEEIKPKTEYMEEDWKWEISEEFQELLLPNSKKERNKNSSIGSLIC